MAAFIKTQCTAPSFLGMTRTRTSVYDGSQIECLESSYIAFNRITNRTRVRRNRRLIVAPPLST
jgi:hypothetical protein